MLTESGTTHKTRRRSPRLLAVALTIAGALAIAGCSGSQPKSNSSAGSQAGAGTFTSIDGTKTITPGAAMNPLAATNNTFAGYDTQQLAYNKSNPTNINDLLPALAASWDWSSDLSTVTIHLNPKAGWSDGTPVTAQDVITTYAATYATGTAASIGFDKVTAVDDKTVQVTQLPGRTSRTFLYNLLTLTVIVPHSQYGSLLPDNIWDLIATANGADAAKAKDAKSQLSDIGKKVTAFSPTTDVSAGPFHITGINAGEAVMEKNPNFWAADKVAPEKVVLRSYQSNEEIWNYLQSGQLDYAPYTAMPQNTADAIKRAGNRMITSPSLVQASIAFNQSYQPFDKVEVRQAFAHILDRSAITKVGQPVGGAPVEKQTGLVKLATDAWATEETKAKLDSYQPDKAKAETLLQQAGLTKGSDGKWQYQGKPWSVTLQTVSGFSDWIAASAVVCSQLSDFGIDCQTNVSADFTTYQADMKAGKFPMGWWLVGVGNNPVTAMGRIFGDAYGYTFAGGKVQYSAPADKAGNWIGGPQEVKLTDGTTIKPGELTMLMNNQSVDEQKPVMQQLMLAENSALPVIGIWDYTNVVFVNEARFTNFPDGSDAGFMRLPPGVWMANGYITKK